MNDYKLLITLKKFVLIKSGLNHVDPGHCKNISEHIFNDTKNYISETTIKRFFGFASTQHKFSSFTLNSLCQYIGYTDWSSFKQQHVEHVVSPTNAWEHLKIRAQAITTPSLTIKKNKSGIPFEYTAERTFFYPDFDYFLNNDYQLTTISAPPGHGKSIILAHMVEHFFLSEEARYKNDIVLLVNSATIRSIIQSKLTIEDWFFRHLNFKNINELFAYAKENPVDIKGRFVLIIDGIDEFLTTLTNQKIFIDLLYSVEYSSFFKVLLVLRANTWANLKPIISASAFLSKSWFKGIFFDVENQFNVPALSVKEITHTLSKIEGREIGKSDVNERLLRQFQIPLWIQIYYTIKNERSELNLTNTIICYEMIDYFLNQRVFLTQKSTEKIFLLKKIAESNSKGKKGLRVAKEILLNDIATYNQAYKELILSGIIIEEKRLSTTVPSEVIRFINYDIYTYFIFLKNIEKFNYDVEDEIFLFILHQYKDESLSRGYILNWLIRFCIKRNKFEVLKNIFKLPFANEEKKQSIDFICNCILYELTDPNSVLKIDRNLIDIFITCKGISPLYKKTIKTIAQLELDEDLRILINTIECNINIIEFDKFTLQKNIHFLKRNYRRAGEMFPLNPADLATFFYNNLINKLDEDETLNATIIQLSEELNNPTISKRTNIDPLAMLNYRSILVVLFTQKKYLACYCFALGVLNRYPFIIFNRNSTFVMFLLTVFGHVCIKLKYMDRAGKIITFLDKIISTNFAYHPTDIDAYFYALKAVYFNQKKEYKKALTNINAGIKLAEQHQFLMTSISFLLVKTDILRQFNQDGNLPNTLIELLDLIKNHKLDIPPYINLISNDLNETFNVIKSYSYS